MRSRRWHCVLILALTPAGLHCQQQPGVDLSRLGALDRNWYICRGVQVTGPSFATTDCRTDLAAATPAQPALTQGPVTFSGGG